MKFCSELRFSSATSFVLASLVQPSSFIGRAPCQVTTWCLPALWGRTWKKWALAGVKEEEGFCCRHREHLALVQPPYCVTPTLLPPRCSNWSVGLVLTNWKKSPLLDRLLTPAGAEAFRMHQWAEVLICSGRTKGEGQWSNNSYCWAAARDGHFPRMI